MPQREDYQLRHIEEGDLTRVLEWRNSKRIRQFMFSDHIITMKEHMDWFKKIKQEKNTICKIFEYKGRPIGLVNIYQIDRRNKKCFWGFYLGEENLPHGTGTIMGFLALEYIFFQLQMRKLCGEVFAFNQASLNYFNKLGFIREGYFKKHVKKNRKYEDVIFFSLFKKDWVKIRKKLEKICFGSKEPCGK
ncbi:MAG: UDP-4-amino-4,6-dideoxy-N-acetyl-beta-L-altrosamine N-acetyltransferase [Desulfotomaculales bacterium]